MAYDLGDTRPRKRPKDIPSSTELPDARYNENGQITPNVLNEWYQRGRVLGSQGEDPTSWSAYWNSPSFALNNHKNPQQEEEYLRGINEGLGRIPTKPVNNRPRPVPQINPTVSVPASAPAVQSAPDYNSMSFGQAFNAARKAGLSEFSWRDKGRFNTRLATEENPMQVAAQAPVTPMEQAPVEVPVPVQAAPAMQRQPVATGYGSGLPSGNALVQSDPRLREIYARIRAENAAKQATAMASGL